MSNDFAVVLDTDVFSRLFVSPTRGLPTALPIDAWRERVAGRRVLIGFQTRAELLAGARAGHWGTRRYEGLVRQLERTPTISLDESVLQAYVDLTVNTRSSGHALHQKQHVADRWVAAVAIAKSLPLLSGDQVYRGAPGLTFLG